MTRPRIGCHLSLGSKPQIAYSEAAKYGVECVQIFASSPGAWKAPLPHGPRQEAATDARRALGIAPLFIHAIYLINLASEDEVLANRGVQSLISTLHAGTLLGASGVITHIGTHAGRGFDWVAGTIADRLGTILEASPAGIDLVLENSAGAGGLIGASLGELAMLVQLTGNRPRLKVALDTAHLCGAGWDFSEKDAAGRLVAEIGESIGVDRLAVLHANDSKAPPGSRRDRHAAVGEGYVGIAGFESLMAQTLLRSVPWICETPDLADTEADTRFGSVKILRALARGKPAPRRRKGSAARAKPAEKDRYS